MFCLNLGKQIFKTKKVFVCQHKEKMFISVCFYTREDAEKYIGGKDDFEIIELNIAEYGGK